MPQPKAGGRATPDRPKLPTIDVARFEEIGHLMERVVTENQRLFIGHGQAYREAHRDGTRRRLTGVEAAQLAAAALDERSVEDRAVAFQRSELSAYDEPDPREVLLAAGAATAPAFVKAVREAVALIEMPTVEFWAAIDEDRLEEAIAAAARELRKADLSDARERAKAAMDHFAAESRVNPGKVLSQVSETLWAALTSAMMALGSQSSSQTESELLSTGPDEKSSVSPGETP